MHPHNWNTSARMGSNWPWGRRKCPYVPSSTQDRGVVVAVVAVCVVEVSFVVGAVDASGVVGVVPALDGGQFLFLCCQRNRYSWLAPIDDKMAAGKPTTVGW